jgi:hypothetical protein
MIFDMFRILDTFGVVQVAAAPDPFLFIGRPRRGMSRRKHNASPKGHSRALREGLRGGIGEEADPVCQIGG